MAERPAHLKAPAYLSKNPPLPQSSPESPNETAAAPAHAGDSRDPTRYGDWTLNGIAVDF